MIIKPRFVASRLNANDPCARYPVPLCRETAIKTRRELIDTLHIVGFDEFNGSPSPFLFCPLFIIGVLLYCDLVPPRNKERDNLRYQQHGRGTQIPQLRDSLSRLLFENLNPARYDIEIFDVQFISHVHSTYYWIW